jgi:hypothetical protein
MPTLFIINLEAHRGNHLIATMRDFHEEEKTTPREAVET